MTRDDDIALRGGHRRSIHVCESGWWSQRGSSSEENVYPPVRTLPVVYQRCGSKKIFEL